MPGFFEIYVETNFSAAHSLVGYQGDCARVHGHNWSVEVFVRCKELDNIGIGIDFREIKTTVKDVLMNLDHFNLAAIIASYLAARWSLRKIYSEKWWDRKERAYSDIIASLYDIMQYCEYQRDHYEWGRELSEDKEKEFREKYNDAYWKLKKVTDIGGFVISKDAADVLKDLRGRPKLDWDDNPPCEIYNQDYEYHKQTLDKVVAIANRDLKATKA